MNLVIRTQGDPLSLVSAYRKEVNALKKIRPAQLRQSGRYWSG